jgi:LysR substrate binding domain
MTFVQTPALALLPLALDQLNAAAPNLQVEVVQMETAPAVEALRSRAVDLVVGIEYEPVPVSRHRDIDRRDLLRESVLLTVHLDAGYDYQPCWQALAARGMLGRSPRGGASPDPGEPALAGRAHPRLGQPVRQAARAHRAPPPGRGVLAGAG